MMNHHLTAAACTLALAGACSTSPEARLVCSFDDATPGAVPAAWQPAETNGRGTPGTWRAAAEEGGGIVRLDATANRGQTFNLLLAPGRYPPDVAVSVRLRADTGREDQGGGVVWRALDADNYYIARWNPLEHNLRAYEVVQGKRTQLASADTVVGSGWHGLEVTARGPRVEVALDGVVLLRFSDSRFAGGGRVGLWTKADAATSFDDFRVAPAGGGGTPR